MRCFSSPAYLVGFSILYFSISFFEFDEDYFEDKDRRDLYVFYSALVDEDVFSFLDYVWHHVYDEKLSEHIIHQKIENLKEKGVRF